MQGRDNIWICLSDLLAGIMAFFVFVSAGIYIDYLGMEGLALGEMSAPKRTIETRTGFATGIKLPGMLLPGVTMDGNGVFYHADFFQAGNYKLNYNQKKEMTGLIAAFSQALGAEPVKILIVGHASCACDVPEDLSEPLSKRGIDWDTLSASERKRERYAAAVNYNMTLSIRRAHALFQEFWSKSDAIRKNGRDNIRYIGLGEQQAVLLDGDVKCQSRSNGNHMPDEAQSAVIYLLKEWPKTVDFAAAN